MNLLLDPLPEAITVSGKSVPIVADAATWMRFEQLLLERAPDEWKAVAALDLCLCAATDDAAEALHSLLWFYRCGAEERYENGRRAGRATSRIYDYGQDGALVYAAFRGQYGLDAEDIRNLHWWKFRALFDGLKEDQAIVKIMGYRAMDVSKIKDKAQRGHYRKLQAQYRLDRQLDEQDKAKLAGAVFGGGL